MGLDAPIMSTAARLPAALLPGRERSGLPSGSGEHSVEGGAAGRADKGKGTTCSSHEGTYVKSSRYKVSSTGPELPQPSHRLHPTSCIRKLLASTSQHRNTHKHEPPEKGSFPLYITQKSLACKGGRALPIRRMAFLIHKELPCTDTPLFKSLGWKDTYKQVPSTLKIPAVDPLVPLTLLTVIHLFPIKAFPPLFVFGGSLGEHNRCQTHTNLSIPFPKGYLISSK